MKVGACKITKPVSFFKYNNYFKLFQKDPEELATFKHVSIYRNELLDTIINNIYDLNKVFYIKNVWYRFHCVKFSENNIRLTQAVILNPNDEEISTVRYVDIILT
jgi:hypothetical protein